MADYYGLNSFTSSVKEVNMAHECPECGQTCYCGGDIGDCCFNLEKGVLNCTHWKECEKANVHEDYDESWDEGLPHPVSQILD